MSVQLSYFPYRSEHTARNIRIARSQTANVKTNVLLHNHR